MNIQDFHGSDIEAIADYYGLDKAGIISFASNVNPLGLSDKLKTKLCEHIEVITRYPERDYATLRARLSDYVNVPSTHITVGNGTTELIRGVITAVSPEDAILFAPSYSEYEREVNLTGGKVRYFPLLEENAFLPDLDNLKGFIQDNTSLIILCNPNNPTGNALNHEQLNTLLSLAKENNITVMIDETYIEFSYNLSDYEAISLTNNFDNLVVLRGVSKFYSCPGIRLGYAVSSNPDLLSRINASKDPWSINSLAEEAGTIMFTDTAFQKKCQEYTKSALNFIKSSLEPCGKFEFYKTESNFMLIKLVNTDLTSTDLFDACAKEGMVIRDCSSFPYLGDKFIRIAPLLESDNERLVKKLLELVK